MVLMTISWIIFGIGIAVAVGLVATFWRRRDQDVDLGNVSHQWIAEQRLGLGHDPQR